ncbi:MAG: endonuclease III [Planctomycetota bacterium]|nr:MAG: endonuclease III [Planctomycetota bacterium]
MRRADKVQRIAQILDTLYPEPAVPLRHRDPFTLLVAVVLSAQSTDKKVNEITPRLFARAPDAASLARLQLAEIQELIRQVGLAPTKARHLKAMAERLVREHAGQVPRDLAALERLPGVGHKTASVVMVQAFGEPAFPVDTHIHRLAARWGLSAGRSRERTERDLKKLFPPEQWGKRHLQMILFGREHCPARGHDPARCPICSWAAPRRRGRHEAARRARPRRRTRTGSRRAG